MASSDNRLSDWWYHGPIAFVIGPVKNVPFEARFEETQIASGTGCAALEKKSTGMIYRDSAGRVRTELRLPEGNGETVDLVLLVDFSARTVVVLDVASQAATKFTEFGPPPGPWRGAACWAFSGPWSSEDGAEERLIEGVGCRRAQAIAWPLGSSAPPAVAGELWLSDEIKWSVLERVSEPGREHTWRVYDIRRAEPPGSLFIVPAEYTTVLRSKFDTPPGQ